MKLYINRIPVRGPWGGGNNFVKAAYACLSSKSMLVDPADDASSFNTRPDAMLLIGLNAEGPCASFDQAIMYKTLVNPSAKIVLRVNENDARKGTQHVDRMLVKASQHVDGTVFVSQWLKDYFEKQGWKCDNNTVIYNGVRNDIFKPGEKFNNGKINILAHHWSNNPMKGFDIYEKIDSYVAEHNDRYTFTYIGRDRGTFKNTNVIRPTYGKSLGEELGRYDVYVSASRFDPGPNHIIESIACGLPTYVHAEGGGCVEFAGSDHVFNSWDDLKMILDMQKFSLNYSAPVFSTWDECVNSYVKFIEGIK